MDEQDQVDGSAKPAMIPNEPRFGLRVEIDGEPQRVRELGSFDIADQEGKLFSVAVKEQSYGTSMESIEAIHYSFERRGRGSFASPRFWSLLTALSGMATLTLFILNLTKVELQLPLPTWIVYTALGLIFVGSTFMELRRVSEFMVLLGTGNILDELERRATDGPVIDLPRGRLAELRTTVEKALEPLTPGRLLAGSELRAPVTSEDHRKVEEIHGTV